MKRAIVIMAKAPILGEAKTRLAASIGPNAAARLHEAFLLESLSTALATGSERVAFMCPDERHRAAMEAFVSGFPEVSVWVQKRPGLMAGIVEAFAGAFEEGAQRVLVSETDSPSLPLGHYAEVFGLLEASTIVLGPCLDGGYYLVGAHDLDDQHARELFEGEAYDGPTICQATARRAKQMGLTVALGPEWYDVDTVDDLQRLKREVSGRPDGLPKLRVALNQLSA